MMHLRYESNSRVAGGFESKVIVRLGEHRVEARGESTVRKKDAEQSAAAAALAQLQGDVPGDPLQTSASLSQPARTVEVPVGEPEELVNVELCFGEVEVKRRVLAFSGTTRIEKIIQEYRPSDVPAGSTLCLVDSEGAEIAGFITVAEVAAGKPRPLYLKFRVQDAW